MYGIQLQWTKELSSNMREDICAWYCGYLRGRYALDPYQNSRSTILFESDRQRILAYFYLLNKRNFIPKML